MKTQDVRRYEVAIPAETFVAFLRTRFPEIGTGLQLVELDTTKDYQSKQRPFPVLSVTVKLERMVHEQESTLTGASGNREGHSVEPSEAV